MSEKEIMYFNGQPIKDTIVYVNGELSRKSEAKISIYDSGFQHGDGVYEGIRVYDNRIFMLDEHVKRLYESCKSLDINIGVTREEMKEIVKKTIRANKKEKYDNLHIRLQVTRGLKAQTGMNPKFNIGKASIVVCVDVKPPIFNKKGIKLVTSTIRRYPPYLMDSKIHDCNQLNQIMANIESNRQGADEAIMLDVNGFVAETNSTTILMIKDGKLLTPTTDHILVGITREILMGVARENGIEVVERNISIAEFYNADEVFVCGTVGEIVPVYEIDGKKIGTAVPGEKTQWLAEKYRSLTQTLGTQID